MRLAGAVEPHHGAPANVTVTASAAVAVAVVAVGSSLGARRWCRDKRCQCQSPAAATTITTTTRTTATTTIRTLPSYDAVTANGAATATDAADENDVDARLEASLSSACHTATDVLHERDNSQSNRINNKKKKNCTHRKYTSKVEQAEQQEGEQQPQENCKAAEADVDVDADVKAAKDVEKGKGVEQQTQQQRNITTRQNYCENTTSNAIAQTGVYNNNQNSYTHNRISNNNDREIHSAENQYAPEIVTNRNYNNNSNNFNEINEISDKHINVKAAKVSREKCYRNNFKASNMAAANADIGCKTPSNSNNNHQFGSGLPAPTLSLRCCATLLALLAVSLVEMCAVGWLRVQQSLMSYGSNKTSSNYNNDKMLQNGVASLSPKFSPPSPFVAAIAFIRASTPTPTAAVRHASVSQRRGRRSVAAAVLCLLYAVLALPPTVRADDSDTFFAVNSFSMAPETVTPEFDYASRGQKKFGDKCDNTLECGFPGSICDPKKKSCQCTEDLPVTNHIDKCGKEAAVNESCFFNEQCEMKYFQTECRDGRCVCRFDMTPIWGKDGTVECKGRQDKRGTETYIDPAMIGVLVGMALMFIIICVVLRLFSQARWRENRTIFNTPNPRLMNVSLLRDSKLLHGQERRGSRMSVRAPSRQPSMASLRPHSPNPSLGSHSGSGSASNASATSVRSTRSNSVAPGNVVSNSHHERKASQHQHHHQSPPPAPPQQQHHQHQHQQQQQMPLITNITANPAAESVTVEIIEPEK